MSQIKVHTDHTLQDPELLALGRHIVAEIMLSAQKAAAHVADPAEFPIPADAELEQVFLERLRSLPQDRRRRAGAKAAELLRGPQEARKALFGHLCDADVREARPVSEIVRTRPAPPLRLTAQRIGEALSSRPVREEAQPRPVQPRDANEWLELRLHEVVCVDETDPEPLGRDHMNLAVVLMDSILRTTKSPIYDLGHFGEDGATRSYPAPLVLGGWDLRVGFYWPRTVSAFVYLSEIDNGGFPEFLAKVLDFVKGKVASAVAAGLGALIGGLIGQGLGALVGLLVGWVIGEVIDAIRAWWEDDVFAPAPLTVEIPTADATYNGQFPIEFFGHGGQYRLTVDMRTTTRPSTVPSPGGLITSVLEDMATDIAGVACSLVVDPPPPPSSTVVVDPFSGRIVSMPRAMRSLERPLVFALGRKDGSMMYRDLSRSHGTWTSLGGGFRSGPAVALTDPTRPVVFGRGTDDALWHTWRDSSSSQWSGWHSLGGVLTSAPAATMSGNRLVVAIRGSDNAIWHKWHEGGWSGWHSLGGGSTSAPALVQSGNRLVVFCRGTDGAIWHKWYEGGWSDWSSLGGGSSSGPAAMVDSGGRLVVFCRGNDGAIYHKWYEGGWSDWHSLGGGFFSAPAAMVGGKAQSTVFCRGTDSAIYESHWAGGWTQWASLGIP